MTCRTLCSYWINRPSSKQAVLHFFSRHHINVVRKEKWSEIPAFFYHVILQACLKDISWKGHLFETLGALDLYTVKHFGETEVEHVVTGEFLVLCQSAWSQPGKCLFKWDEKQLGHLYILLAKSKMICFHLLHSAQVISCRKSAVMYTQTRFSVHSSPETALENSMGFFYYNVWPFKTF